MSRPAAARPVLVGLPFDAASTFLRGAAEAPPRIREALHSPASNLWTETGIDLGAPGVMEDAGDLELPADEGARERIESGIRALLDRKLRPISLGGDHSVTYPILRAVRPHTPRLSILQIDAHPDLYDTFEGSRFTHASPFARILEEGLADRLVQVGIRTMNGVQREQAHRYGVDVLDMRAWAAGARPRLQGAVYVSIDVDAFDPAFAPGVSHREPGGFSVRDVLGLLEGVHGSLVGADIVEFNPRQDPAGITAPVCAKLVKELAARMIAGPRWDEDSGAGHP